jgi:hypothetical protein
MRWLQLKAAVAARLAWQDVWQVGAPRVATGLAVNAIAVVLALILTKQLIALWAIAAAPIYVFLTWCVFAIRRMRGWNRLWKSECSIARIATGPQINLAIQTMRPADLLSGKSIELECLVRDPSGQETKDSSMTGFYKTRVYASYPGQFAGAPQMVPGTYLLIWREQNPPETGKWRIIDLDRVTLSEHDFQDPDAGQASATASA